MSPLTRPRPCGLPTSAWRTACFSLAAPPGLHAALALFCRPGDQVLIDRGCHRAVYNALALLDLEPSICPAWRAGRGSAGPISPQDVENLLDSHPNIKTICITSPTYSGVLSDVAELPTLSMPEVENSSWTEPTGLTCRFWVWTPFPAATPSSALPTRPCLPWASPPWLFTQRGGPRRVRR